MKRLATSFSFSCSFGSFEGTARKLKSYMIIIQNIIFHQMNVFTIQKNVVTFRGGVGVYAHSNPPPTQVSQNL